ncbi:hypothetical protein BU23DRAFT_491211 [Bimuria novae-zelandiae CBS 107.79]|uniref:ABM domain-containing protein n=1 Tax=Bimuria novae-zelandiae CBS 107.79 TaxID=1447943 RepID=A0A6A5UKQ6_9PLEO|nr:hypothetical protein BU23DRAFT_491211 [Bimuria novae-zelandiae CBS 107.79]
MSTTVTELARLTIKDGLRESHKATLEQSLARAKKGMEDFTGQKFYMYQEVENPNHIYIIGEWASLEQHMKDWIPSEQNQALLQGLGPLVEVDFLFHLDQRLGLIPPSQSAPMLGCVKHVMESAKRPDFERTFINCKNHLEAFTLGPVGAGWRIEKESDREEFVLFSPWKDVAEHLAFGKTKDFQEYSKIKDYIMIDATQIVHIVLMELPLA